MGVDVPYFRPLRESIEPEPEPDPPTKPLQLRPTPPHPPQCASAELCSFIRREALIKHKACVTRAPQIREQTARGRERERARVRERQCERDVARDYICYASRLSSKDLQFCRGVCPGDCGDREGWSKTDATHARDTYF